MHKVFILAVIISASPLWQGFSNHQFISSAKKQAADNVFHFKNNAVLNNIFENKKDAAIDTTSLKQSDWYAGIIKNIAASEYEIKKDEQTGLYSAPNRQQEVRALFNYNNFSIQPRNTACKSWKLDLQLKGIYANDKLIAQPTENDLPQAVSNKITFNNDNFSTEYINSQEGVRQNFIIRKKPTVSSSKIRVQLSANKGWHINKVHDKELHFAKMESGHLSKKITYNSLKVWDANNKELAAKFVVNKKLNAFDIEVNADGAVYPITVDPLSTGVSGTVDWAGDDANQTNAYFGVSVASAGDVNGDGYSDVIIGAPRFDDGASTDEGRAFVYYGSSTGLSLSPNNTPDDGDQPNCYFGISVASAGDVNGDGYSDVIIGASGYIDAGNVSEGRAFVYYGSAGGLGISPVSILDDADLPNAFFGVSVACAGDVNGDGYSDVIVGAYGYDDGVNLIEGRAFIYHGSGAGLSASPNSTPDDADQDGARFGVWVASAGDVNGDGYSDVIIGAHYYDDGINIDEGKAFVYYGSPAGISSSPDSTPDDADQAGAYFGRSVASAGDVNGDGYSDVIIGAFGFDNGANTDEGRAFVYYGSPAGLSNSPNSIPDDANQANAFFGWCVAAAGDVNGDGYSDVIIGASNYDDGANTDEGRAFVYYGGATGLSASPNSMPDDSDQPGASFGWCVASAGDVNGDGYSDVIIGASNYDDGANTDEGNSFVYHGSAGGLSATQTHTLSPDTQNQAGIGNAVAGAGDVNGDGYSDVIIGAHAYDDGGSFDEGRAWVYYGSATGLSATPDVILDDANQADVHFGYSVAGAGDVNGDGYADIVIGGYGYDESNVNEGRAWVHYGGPAGLSVIANRFLDDANQDGAGFGVSVASAGDINGDGYGDIVVGAYSYDDNFADEGRAFVYYGGIAGLSATPASTPDDADQLAASFGGTVACAGDINGDGFSDVLVGALLYDDNFVNEGVVFVYYGGASGLSASPNAILDDGNQLNASFGRLAVGAGDVNGDGFADVLVTSILYDSQKGRGWVYYGSATGLSATPNVILDNTAGNAGDRLGYGASSAGDLNGDGYSDIIIGIPECTVNFAQDGKAYIYYGSATGLSATPGLTINDATEQHEFFGLSTACAGDINGDGYSDVIIGADHGSWASPVGGRAYIHNGNNLIANKRNNLLLYNTDLSTPISSVNFPLGNFGAGLFAKSFLGRDKGKLVWETRLNYNSYSGTPITNSTFFTAQQAAYTDLGVAGTNLKTIVDKITGGGNFTKLRARVKYNLTTAITGQVYGPWRYVSPIIDGNLLGALPINLLSFKADWLQKGKAAQLRFTTDKENGICCFEIEKSWDGFNFNTIGTVAAKNIGGIQSYSFNDNSSFSKNQFYRLKIKGNTGKIEFSNIQQLQDNMVTEIVVFPNPVSEILQLQLNKDYNKINIQVVNSSGQVVKQLTGVTISNQQLQIPVNNLPAGNYWLQLQTGTEKQTLQFIKK